MAGPEIRLREVGDDTVIDVLRLEAAGFLRGALEENEDGAFTQLFGWSRAGRGAGAR